MGYNATADYTVRKVHTCVHCDGSFGYVMKRSLTGTGASAEQAQENLKNTARNVLETNVDTHPCPTCGMVQPEMMAARNTWRYLIAGAVTAVAMFVFCIFFWTHFLSLENLMYTLLGVYGVLVAWCMKRMLTNPNTNLSRNLQTAKKEVSAGEVELLEAGSLEGKNAKLARQATYGWDGVTAGCFAVALLLGCLPGGLQTLRGWPLNEAFFPAVVGPGDEATYYFEKEISSIKGYWRGKVGAALVGVEGLGEQGLVTLKATTEDKSWGKTIRFKSSQKADKSTIYSTIEFPDEPALANKGINMVAKILYQYPKMGIGKSFRVVSSQLEAEETIQFAESGAGTMYSQAAWAAILLGGFFVCFGCYRAYKQVSLWVGNPRQTLPVR